MWHLLVDPIWALVWHWGVGIGVAILLFAAAYFSPIFKLKLFLAGVMVIFCLLAYGVGIVDANRLCSAREAVVTAEVHKAVKSTTTAKSKKAADPWDRKSY